MARLLNSRHEVVAQELAAGKTAVEASREAGYEDGSSFDANARKRASRKDVQARVHELQVRAANLAEIDRGYILTRLKDLSEFNLADYLAKDPDGNVFLNIKDCSRADLGRLVELTQETFDEKKDKHTKVHLRRTKLKGVDVLSALGQMARIIGVEKDQTAEALTGIGERLQAALARVNAPV